VSALSIQKFCRDILHDMQFRELALSNPEEAVSRYEFTLEERASLLKGDVARLHQLGASGFLLLILSRFQIFGLSLDVYNSRMRKLSQDLNDKNV
jgi:hypothetical protein